MSTVVSLGHVIVGGTGGGTVNDAVQVIVFAQSSTTVHVTVTVPPQKSGAAGALLDIEALHPPEKVASVAATQSAKAASTAA